jgi:nicotinamide mononucleotide adenylyltransferase
MYSIRDKYAVWVGRLQPYHISHLSVLRRSLETWDAPHVNGIVCHDYDLMGSDLPAKHARVYNPFTPWERYFMVRTCLASLGLSHRVDTVFVPFLKVEQWGVTSKYLPERFFFCTTNKDREDLDKIKVWDALGWESAVLDVSGMRMHSSSDVRRAVASGQDWREFIHESAHEYFENIDGPARLLRSAREVIASE